MRIAVTGSTGFIGKGLVKRLSESGHEIIALTRNTNRAMKVLGARVRCAEFPGDNPERAAAVLEGIDTIVNLAGENIGSFLWTKRKRGKIIDSRVRIGRFITEIIRIMRNPPEVLVQASAVGYYGSRGDSILTETSDKGSGFLPKVVTEWEGSVAEVESLGVRTVIMRSGVVISPDGGAFPKLSLPYRLGVGTLLGSGIQWLPWIYFEDEIRAVIFLLLTKKCSGTYNLVAPNPERMSEICRRLGPTRLSIPPAILRFVLGDMGNETILTSQRVLPERLTAEGFVFQFPRIADIPAMVFNRKTDSPPLQ
ncbi:MAG TPA: TIGR01777 family oxidoreductase [Candidatus Kryptonia bacterium]